MHEVGETRLADAEELERGLHLGRLGRAMRLRKRSDSPKQHVGALQENTQSGLEELETVVRQLIGVPAHGIMVR